MPYQAAIFVKHCLNFLLLWYAGISLSAQTTYYSRNATSGGNWNTSNSWTTNADGSGGPAAIPGRNDNIVVLNGHTISVTATNANGSAGISADGLNRPNVGAFTESGTANFYQTGNISVNSGGALITTVRIMTEGYTLIDGTFTSSLDLINLGRLVVSAGATLTLNDDFILSGTSKTQLDNTINSDDDLYIDHTEARLCGLAAMNIGVSSPNTPVINYWNSASVAQICSDLQVTCGPGGGCSGFPVSGTGGFSFALDSFNYYKYLTIRSSMVTADLTDFPVLISFSDPDIRAVADGGSVENANGYDIIFATSSSCGELTQLDHQLETYTSTGTTGNIVAWVKVPSVSSSTDTEIYMYYGNSDQTTDLSVTTAFDYNHVNVYHLHNDFNDASPYGNDATNGGSADQVNSKIGDGQTFGMNDYIEAPTSDMTAGAGTFSAWCNATSFSGNHQYIVGHSTVPVYNNRFQLYTNDATGDLDLGLGNNHNALLNIIDFNTNQWYHIAITWSGGNHTIYVDGAQQANGAYTAFTTLHTFFDIGNDGNAATRNEGWIGDLDEIRMSRTVRSADWIATSFNNQNEPDSFFTVGSQLANTCIALPIELLDFIATPIGDIVELDWTTLSETNNAFFTVDKSRDLKSWTIVGEKEGAGTSRTLLRYNLVDDAPWPGTSYYRLHQTDYDGKTTIKKTVAVRIDGNGLPYIYPNPNTGSFSLSVDKMINTEDIRIFDVLQRNIPVVIEGDAPFYTLKLKNAEPGYYWLRFAGKSGSHTLPFIVE